jgi:SAM-dependent methyltransferase
MSFKANGKEYEIDPHLRNTLKPDWRMIFKPVKVEDKYILASPYKALPFISKAEEELHELNTSLVGKDILEVGCGYGHRAYLMAKYEGTKVHGIDVDDYLVNQSIDLNIWNPKDVDFIHTKIDKVRSEIGGRFPKTIQDKVTFETCGMEKYATPNPHDIIISFDVLEHLTDLPMAFQQMSNSLKTDGIVYHEYNSFFSLNGGHSLCTLDFLYGHCRLSPEDFLRYIRELRPDEEKTAMNFYHKCLNRMTKKDLFELVKNSGFEVLNFSHRSAYEITGKIRESLEKEVLPDVVKQYPDCTIEDLTYDSAQIILRKL